MNNAKELLKAVEIRDKISAKMKELETKKKEYDAIIKALLKEPQKVEVGNYFISWIETTSRRVDTKKLKTEYPDIANACTTEIKSQRLTVSKKKG